MPAFFMLCLVIAVVGALIYRGHLGSSGTPSASNPATTPTALTTASAASTQQSGPPASGVQGSSNGATIVLVTAAGVDSNFLPVGVSSRFRMSEGDVFAVATVRNKAQGDAVKFTWRYPDGTTFVYNNEAIASIGGTVVGYASLPPTMLGTYTVSTAINGRTLASASFTVISG